ncbi:MAG: anti-sigma factor family protein [Vicinamibacterales bacterium]
MQCDDLSNVLVDFIDGRLDPDAERAVERHLDSCADCRALVVDLRTIRAAAFMLDRHEPGPDVWKSLQERVAAEPAPRGRVLALPATRASWSVWFAAAAAIVLATLIGVLPFLRRDAQPVQPPEASAGAEATVESVTAEFEAAERHYQKAISDLETIAKQDTGELDPQVAAVLQRNLSVIDQAIGESRAALQSQPSNDTAQEGLFDGLRTKVALLQQTVELINEMRKGNQVEAGRKFQTLPQ